MGQLAGAGLVDSFAIPSRAALIVATGNPLRLVITNSDGISAEIGVPSSNDIANVFAELDAKLKDTSSLLLVVDEQLIESAPRFVIRLQQWLTQQPRETRISFTR